MKIGIRELTDLNLARMEEILEFRAFTQLSYISYKNAVDSGFKQTAHLGPTNRTFDQNDINQKLQGYEAKFLPQLSFQYAISVFETWLFDVLKHLLSDKNRLNKKRKIEVSEIVAANTLEELMTCIIESELNELKYKKTSEWFIYLQSFVKLTSPSQAQIDSIMEIKASRDIIVHNSGYANQIYIEKSGGLARAKDGARLVFDHDYVFASWQTLNVVMKEVGNQISAKIDA